MFQAFRDAFRPSEASIPSLLAGRAFAFAGVVAIAALPSPALADSRAETKLVNCGAQDCLEVSGYRENAAAVVAINGNPVSVEGENGWRVRLPIDTVREWSAPYARNIEISLQDQDNGELSATSARLPIGLLGGTTELTSLEIRAR